MYSLGFNEIKHKGANIKTLLHAQSVDEILKNLDTAYEYDIGYIPIGYENRPDLISNIFYGTPENWWLLMLVNGINDPFEGFTINQKILIPKLK